MLTCGRTHQAGFSLLAVLIAVVLLAFGLIPLVALLNKLQIAQFEGYQRAQAVVLLQDMVERININRSHATSYITSTPLGTGNTIQTCSSTPGAAMDLCEWNNALLGAAEILSASGVGAMLGARGCITLVQAANTSSGACIPGEYRVSIAWQGMQPGSAPSDTCGQGQYGDNDGLRRLISTTITIGLPTC